VPERNSNSDENYSQNRILEEISLLSAKIFASINELKRVVKELIELAKEYKENLSSKVNSFLFYLFYLFVLFILFYSKSNLILIFSKELSTFVRGTFCTSLAKILSVGFQKTTESKLNPPTKRSLWNIVEVSIFGTTFSLIIIMTNIFLKFH